MKREIERYIGRRMTPAKVPTHADVAARRLALFKDRLLKTLQEEDLELYLSLVEAVAQESGREMTEVAAAAARLARGDKPLVVPLEPKPEQVARVETGMTRLLVDAGRSHGVRPADIVGAIANEAGVPGRAIGAIDIYDDFTLVDVPAEFLAQVLAGMSGASIRSQPVRVRPATPRDVPPPQARRPADRRGAPPARPYKGKPKPGGFAAKRVKPKKQRRA